MATFKVTAKTTNEAIEKATKEQIICALFDGRLAPLRDHKRRTWTKAWAVEQAKSERDRLAKDAAAAEAARAALAAPGADDLAGVRAFFGRGEG